MVDMFGYKSSSGSCGCPCSTTGIQSKTLFGSVYESYQCFDLANAIAWINANFDTTLPWAIEPNGYYQQTTANFGSTSATSPSGYAGAGAGMWAPEGGIVAVASGWNLGGIGGSLSPDYYGFPTRQAIVMAHNQAVIGGQWCDTSGDFVDENCLMTGVSQSVDGVYIGYKFDIPIPPGGLCLRSSDTCGEAQVAAIYNLIPLANYDGFFYNSWSGPLPSPCMTGDPFFGDSPP
jgi:hypothetical protein